MIRTLFGLNQDEFAERMRFSRNTIVAVENGGDASPRFIEQLEVLKKSPEIQLKLSAFLHDIVHLSQLQWDQESPADVPLPLPLHAAAVVMRSQVERDQPRQNVEEGAPDYGMVKKIFKIAEEGSAEQKALVNSFLDSVCDQLGIPSRQAVEASKK